MALFIRSFVFVAARWRWISDNDINGRTNILVWSSNFRRSQNYAEHAESARVDPKNILKLQIPTVFVRAVM